MKTIRLSGDHESREVFLDGKPLDPSPSLKVRNHSPAGFNWGYGGSGPAQLALAIMLRVTGKSDGYQDLKFKVIAGLPQSDFEAEVTIDSEKKEYSFKLLAENGE